MGAVRDSLSVSEEFTIASRNSDGTVAYRESFDTAQEAAERIAYVYRLDKVWIEHRWVVKTPWTEVENSADLIATEVQRRDDLIASI